MEDVRDLDHILDDPVEDDSPPLEGDHTKPRFEIVARSAAERRLADRFAARPQSINVATCRRPFAASLKNECMNLGDISPGGPTIYDRIGLHRSNFASFSRIIS